MNVVLDANHARLFDERAQLASLVDRIRQRVAASDAEVDERLRDLDHVRAALCSRRLIMDSVENIADPVTVVKAIIDPIPSDGEIPVPVEPLDVIEHVLGIHRPVIAFLDSSIPSLEDGIRYMQEQLQKRRIQIVQRRSAILERVAAVCDALRQTLALLQRLIAVHKIGRQRIFDDTLIEVLHERAVTFELKLRAMRSRLQLDTYRPGAVQALRCIRDRLRADLDGAHGELDALQRRLGQYEGIVEFDRIVADYCAICKQIGLQKQLIQQLNANVSEM